MSEKKKPAQGDEVYDIHGRAGIFVAQASTGYIVEPIHEHEDYDEPIYGSPETWKEVFSSPPTQKLHAEVAEVEAKLKTVLDELHAVRAERHAEDAAYQARAALRKQFKQLEKLDDFIAGKITHFLVSEGDYYPPRIEEFESFIKTKDRYDKQLRLLSLYGDSKGDLTWNLDRYSDGSGDSWRHGNAWPATSYEDAVSLLSGFLEKRYAMLRKEDPKMRGRASMYADAARKYGLTVPDDIAEWAEQSSAEAKAKTIEAARKAMEEAKARYDAALKS
ncbi:hypothetical protein IAG25_35425 [Caballeronia sp. EK]|uniref:hypothetical protein n=1 Tax=Caballeronia sp. EK TaxID=2767469 RepID=UPI00165622A9|nr:hypothetical protein [Caballeronia sp. EK]MBC8642099.1 hypothetical protein [Caballeronia sp. EK]